MLPMIGCDHDCRPAEAHLLPQLDTFIEGEELKRRIGGHAG